MKWLLALSISFFLAGANAEEIFTSYEDYYRTKNDVVFLNQLKQSSEVYSFQGEHGLCGEKDACRDYAGKFGSRRLLASFSLTRGVFEMNGRRFSYEKSDSLSEAPNTAEQIPFHPETVYFSAKKKNRPDAICIEGYYMGSGRFRMKDVFLILNPFGSTSSLRFLHLPRLHASCSSIRQESNGAIVYPVNSYVWNQEKSEIIGLMMDYFLFKDGKSRALGRAVKIRFVEPGNPFEFLQERP